MLVQLDTYCVSRMSIQPASGAYLRALIRTVARSRQLQVHENKNKLEAHAGVIVYVYVSVHVYVSVNPGNGMAWHGMVSPVYRSVA